jgi:Domain of unknown function (DUF5753)
MTSLHLGTSHSMAGSARSTFLPEQQRQLAALLDLERDANRIVNVSPLLIPGLLQTSGYARAIMIGAKVHPVEIETRVAVRLGRRDVITRRQDPARFLAVIDETALRRNIGGPAVMLDQLRALDEASRWANVDLRIMPVGSDWHPALEGPFVLIEFADRPTVVQVENRRSALFFHEPMDVEIYQQAVDRVTEVTMSPADARGHIASVIDELEKTLCRCRPTSTPGGSPAGAPTHPTVSKWPSERRSVSGTPRTARPVTWTSPRTPGPPSSPP